MSTDYKIGIVVGLVVLIAGIVYFLTSGDGDKIAPPVDTPTGTSVVETNAPVESPGGAPVEIPLTTLEPQTQPATQTPTVAVTPAPATQPVVGFHLDEDAEDASAPIETPATESPAQETVRIQVPTESTEGFQLSEDADAAWSEPDPEPEPVTLRTITPPAEEESADTLSAAGGTYTIKKGDNGYWIIAQRVYGQENGKYWTLIQKANPNADTNALRIGQVLKIPPLPGSASRTPVVTPPSDTTETDSPLRINLTGTTPPASPSGTREYVVAEGDAGLWGIAEKMYGKGQLWEVIQKANPGVKPGSLRVGTKLVIPPLPTATAPRSTATGLTTTTTGTPAGGSPQPRGEVFTENGRQHYIVKSGDMGYWGIAKKVYGDGKYSYLIDRANTGVDALSLQPGDKLIIPPLPAPGETTQPTTSGRSPRPAPRRTAPVRRAPAPVRDGEPDFGP